jgi:hypothetical protein
MKVFKIVFLFTLISFSIYAQIAVKSFPKKESVFAAHNIYFPGIEFPFLKPLKEFDFHDKALRVEFYDDRENLNLQHLNCSTMRITKRWADLASKYGTLNTVDYMNKLLKNAHIKLDSLSDDKFEIHLQALDTRIIGAIYFRVHGLCQVRIQYKGVSKTYCTNFTDADPHSPLGKNAFTTRPEAYRLITAAAVREVTEQFMTDLINQN